MSRPWPAPTVLILLCACLFVVGCGGGTKSQAGSGQLTLKEVTPDMQGADPRLKAIVAQANQLLPGGELAFALRMGKLEGLPVVVNKWASWCGPCREEFPEFQAVAKELGNRVAFLGVNVNDANGDAKAFLKSFPVPYPSYSDPQTKISQSLQPAKYAPVTNIYDASGRLAHSEAGPYKSAAALKSDIERYAGPIKSAPTS